MRDQYISVNIFSF